MGRTEQRIRRLETATGERYLPPVAVSFVGPGPDGPADNGISMMAIPAGGIFVRSHYESDAAFTGAVNAAHLAKHGFPIEWTGDEKFDARDDDGEQR